MIPLGRTLCLPSPATVQELFSVARDASIIPDISLDPVLTSFLSLDSSAALQHQYAFLQRSMNVEQQTAFGLNLTGELGGSSRVAYGGVGVVALALSVLFDHIAQQSSMLKQTSHQVRAQGPTEGEPSIQRSQPKTIFGISRSSRIGWMIYSYLQLIPSIANNQDKMAETTEIYDGWLNLELIDHFVRMTTKKRMSTVSMQQWIVGAAFHLHMRIHQVRLHSVPLGSAESLRRSCMSSLVRLVQGYTSYLHRNIQETPGPRKPRTRIAGGPGQSNTLYRTNTTVSGNDSLVSISVDKVNETTTPSGRSKAGRSSEDFGLNVSNRRDEISDVVNREMQDDTTGHEDVQVQGLLVIEPGRNVSHSVQHHPCQSPAIQQALVTRIINVQDLERNRNIFVFPEKFLHSLLRQKDNFELKQMRRT